MKKLTHEELLDRQADRLKGSKIPLTVVLNNIRSLYNVGSIFRTSDGVGVEKIYLCGITGTPPNNQISKTALGAEESVAWEYIEKAEDAVKLMKGKGYEIVLLEQLKNSVTHDEFVPSRPVCLVLGNEISGVQEQILKNCDQAVEIYMAGLKNSLNVSVAFGVISYHLRKYLKNI